MNNILYIKKNEGEKKADYVLFSEVVYYIKSTGIGQLFGYAQEYISKAKFKIKNKEVDFKAHMKNIGYKKATDKEILSAGKQTAKSLLKDGFKVADKKEIEAYAAIEGMVPLVEKKK